LGTLADGLACLPLGLGPLHPSPHSRVYYMAFGVRQGLVGFDSP
jgi:hypothetical protein